MAIVARKDAVAGNVVDEIFAVVKGLRSTEMAADSYTAADERARAAQKAGLKAKKDEQPVNTARSYTLRSVTGWSREYR
ncbi:hypothetical protein FPOAC1_003973 [Fusarium poae]|uniref:hypothetical protein n=1 Tax=Fusarium poae TaxID=36050 RepID=UPI001CE88A7C|nr:hypothetical protein FPOAC1_003973 [Fusarium poae]KAG8670738.1 hypothetical protein FPOAC1_003973 [Fusarium poae]